MSKNLMLATLFCCFRNYSGWFRHSIGTIISRCFTTMELWRRVDTCQSLQIAIYYGFISKEFNVIHNIFCPHDFQFWHQSKLAPHGAYVYIDMFITFLDHMLKCKLWLHKCKGGFLLHADTLLSRHMIAPSPPSISQASKWCLTYMRVISTSFSQQLGIHILVEVHLQ